MRRELRSYLLKEVNLVQFTTGMGSSAHDRGGSCPSFFFFPFKRSPPSGEVFLTLYPPFLIDLSPTPVERSRPLLRCLSNQPPSQSFWGVAASKVPLVKVLSSSRPSGRLSGVFDVEVTVRCEHIPQAFGHPMMKWSSDVGVSSARAFGSAQE